MTSLQIVVGGLVARGLTNREIARRLGQTEDDIKHILRNGFYRRGVRNRAHLAVCWKCELFQIGMAALRKP